MTGATFYVYEHWRPDTGKCFYVGKGKGKRSQVLYGRNQHHRRIQAKLSVAGLAVEIRIVAKGLTEAAAHQTEIERIAYWKALGVDLANLTSGGEGISDPAPESRAKMRAAKVGRTLTEEHKAKIAAGSRAALARPEVKAKLSAALKIALATPEAKANRSRGQKARARTKEHYEKVSAALRGRKLSPEHVEAMRKGLTGRKQSKEQRDKIYKQWTPARRAQQAEVARRVHASRRKQLELPFSQNGAA